MVILQPVRLSGHLKQHVFAPLRNQSSYQAKRWSSTTHDPLRVLFCGADQFSIYSLKALNDVRLKHPEKVASIDVVCKPDKRVGRGMKKIQEVPIKKVAVEELDLPIHQIDTFTRWSPPPSINLVVAVSFGLLVPPRILNSAKYGGLNVHPSMLPDLRGPAPLHHTLLNRLQKTGVTLQTLHPQHFDQGYIVDQTPQPGLDIPSLHHATVESLLQFVGPLGAEMLERNILTGDFANPDIQKSAMPKAANAISIRHAGKIKPEDRQIIWQQWTANELELRDRVVGRTWATDVHLGLEPRRVTFQGWTDTTADFHDLRTHHHRHLISLTSKESVTEHDSFPAPGTPVIFKEDPSRRLYFGAAGGTVASSAFITVEGKAKVPASSFHQWGMEHGEPVDA